MLLQSRPNKRVLPLKSKLAQSRYSPISHDDSIIRSFFPTDHNHGVQASAKLSAHGRKCNVNADATTTKISSRLAAVLLQII